MGGASSRANPHGAACLAGGMPEELDWAKLVGQVFQPCHNAMLLLTSPYKEVQSGSSRPSKVIQCYRGPSADDASQGPAPIPAEVFQPAMLEGEVGLYSQKGRKPQPNQDAAFYFQFIDSDGAKVWSACVMDGHGPLGHEMSTLVMQWLPLLILREPSLAREAGRTIPLDPQAVFDAIAAAFAKMGQLMRRASSNCDSLERELSGTTCVFTLCARGLLHTANVGDSRAVLGALLPGESSLSLRTDTRALTRDHKPEDVEERIRIEACGGTIARQRVYTTTWPQVGLNLSRSFGDSRVHAVGVSDVPDLTTTFLDAAAELQDGEQNDDGGQKFLIVASDGVWEFMENSEAVETVATKMKDFVEFPKPSQGADLAQACAEKLVQRSENLWRQETGNELDDVTAIIVML